MSQYSLPIISEKLITGAHITRIKLMLEEKRIQQKLVYRPIFLIYDQMEDDPNAMRHRVIKSLDHYAGLVHFTNSKLGNASDELRLSIDKINVVKDYDNTAVIGVKAFIQDIPEIKEKIMSLMAEALAKKLKTLIDSDPDNEQKYRVSYSLLLNSDEVERRHLTEI